MNLPNKLTLFRVFLIPIFLIFININSSLSILISLIVFIIASITDQLDGYIARRYNLITDFGKFADPLADKLLVLAAFISFIELGLINSIFVIIIIFREFLVTGIRLVLAKKNGEVISANGLGKIKTVTQIISIIFILLGFYLQKLIQEFRLTEINGIVNIVNNVGNISFYICVILTIISGWDYIKMNTNNLKEALK